ncbi:MAG: hypothetical protein ACOX75_05595 [Lachnospiraceae bacterium]|jgi:hypothetical protein
MTRIKFKISKDKKYVEIDKNKSLDFNKYQIERSVLCEKDWKIVQDEFMVTDGFRFDLTLNEKLPKFFRVYLIKKGHKEKGYALQRTYYLRVYQKKNNEIDVETRSSSRYCSGDVKAKTWDDSIWKLNKKNLIDKYNNILRFYLLNSPAKEESTPTKQFTDVYALWGKDCFKRGDREQLRAKLSEFKVKGINDNTGGIAGNNDDLKERVEEFQLFKLNEHMLDNLNREGRVVMVDSLKNQYLSLFRHLRNSIAHGSFLIIEDGFQNYFIFQDVYQGKVSARGIISLEILAEWKKIILSKKEEFF